MHRGRRAGDDRQVVRVRETGHDAIAEQRRSALAHPAKIRRRAGFDRLGDVVGLAAIDANDDQPGFSGARYVRPLTTTEDCPDSAIADSCLVGKRRFHGGCQAMALATRRRSQAEETSAATTTMMIEAVSRRRRARRFAARFRADTSPFRLRRKSPPRSRHEKRRPKCRSKCRSMRRAPAAAPRTRKPAGGLPPAERIASTGPGSTASMRLGEKLAREADAEQR